jgi:hypothetical protein
MTLGGAAVTPQIPGIGSLGTSTAKPKTHQGPRQNAGTQADAKCMTIKAALEGGDKRMLDIILERLKYSIRSEWTEGQEVSKILDTYEDVTVTPPERLTNEQKADDLFLEIWKESI